MLLPLEKKPPEEGQGTTTAEKDGSDVWRGCQGKPSIDEKGSWLRGLRKNMVGKRGGGLRQIYYCARQGDDREGFP